MTKGTKRNVINDDTPKVGVNKRKFDKIDLGGCNATVAMLKPKSKQIAQNSQNAKEVVNTTRVNKTIGVKRKIDFNFQKGNNNNAQKVVEDDRSRSVVNKKPRFEISKSQAAARRSGRTVKSKVIQDLPLSDPPKGATTKSIKNFDGIQISVNSDEDEEELDYDDILDDDQGSIQEMKMVENNETNTDSGDDDRAVATDSDILLGASSATISDEEMVMSNPHLRKLLNKMLDERIRSVNEKGENSSSRLLTTKSPTSMDKGKEHPVQTIKSPSDTTIYAPALNKEKHTPEVQFLSNNDLLNKHAISKDRSPVDSRLIHKISNFVDQLHIEHEQTNVTTPSAMEEVGTNTPLVKSKITVPGLQEAQKRTDQAIIEAEKFQASIKTPPGMLPPNFQSMNDESSRGNTIGQTLIPHNTFAQQSDVRQVIGMGGLSDDDFFHLTCHIDASLQQKQKMGAMWIWTNCCLRTGALIQHSSSIMKQNSSGCRVREVHIWSLQKGLVGLIAFVGGNKHSECTQQFIVASIQIDHTKFGNTYQ